MGQFTTLPSSGAGRVAGLLALCALLLAGAALAQPADGACVENPDAPNDGDGFCLACSADGASCEECSEYSVLKDGACVPCEGKGEFGAYCAVCNSTEGPSVCTECLDLNGEQEVGVYATATGQCALCPLDGCTVCASPGGECTSCGFAQGLVGGACAPCIDQETCEACNGDAAKCSSCSQGHFADAAGLCVACLANCTVCSDAITCEECTAGTTWDAATSACVPCLDQNCVECSTASNCTACDGGWTAQNGACTQCPEGCGTCDLDPTKCDEDSSCLDEYGPGDAPGICKKCLTANCTTCGGTYTACTECALGFRFDAPTDQCQACTVEHCKDCTTAAGTCDFCADGYRANDAGDACEPCAGAQCLECMTDAATCDWCAEGFSLDSAGACQPETA